MTLRSRRVPVALIVGAALLLAAPAAAQDDEAFKEGLSARDGERWAEAAAHMRRAIEADGQESSRMVRSGISTFIRVGGTPYLPHYFLGEALRNSGDCGGAVEAWEQSEDQGVVSRHPDQLAGLQAGYKECAARGVLLRTDYRREANDADRRYTETFRLWQRLGQTRADNPELWSADADADYNEAQGTLLEAQGLLDRGQRTRLRADFAASVTAISRASGLLQPLDARLSTALDTRAVVREGADRVEDLLAQSQADDRAIDALQEALPPPLASSRAEGRRQIARARERLAEARKSSDTGNVDEALQAAEAAATVMRTVLAETRRKAREEAVLAWNDTFAFLQSSMATLEQRAAQKPADAEALAEALDALRADPPALERRFRAASGSDNVAGIRAATRLAEEARTKADRLVLAFGPVTLRDRGVHEALEEGARAYLAGEYQLAIKTLGSEGLDDAPLQVHVHLFRAASLYALYLQSGEANQVLRDAAVAAVARAKAIDPDFQPSARAFTPRFIDFFTRAGATETLTATTLQQP